MNIEIKALEPSLIDDFLYFFDKIGFADNPDWSSCYCQYYHFDGSRSEWSNRTKLQNRNASKILILSGEMQGFIAYSEKNPIGWCNVNMKEKYSHIIFKDEFEEEKKIGAVVCFLIAPNYRRKGISRLLLKEVCKYYKNKNFDYIEAYPIKNGESDAHNYHGPYSLFLSEGFSVINELEGFYVMRKKL